MMKKSFFDFGVKGMEWGKHKAKEEKSNEDHKYAKEISQKYQHYIKKVCDKGENDV